MLYRYTHIFGKVYYKSYWNRLYYVFLLICLIGQIFAFILMYIQIVPSLAMKGLYAKNVENKSFLSYLLKSESFKEFRYGSQFKGKAKPKKQVKIQMSRKLCRTMHLNICTDCLSLIFNFINWCEKKLKWTQDNGQQLKLADVPVPPNGSIHEVMEDGSH